MHTLLKSQSQAPSRNESLIRTESGKDHLSANLRRKLLFRHYSNFDWYEGGSNGPIKYLDRDSIEYALCQAAHHDRNEERMAKLYLNRGMSLVDDDGGIFQFASGPDWKRCRYSKSVASQAGSLRLYSLAYAQSGEHDYLLTARRIFSYIRNELLTSACLFRSVSIPMMADKNKSSNKTRGLPFRIRDNGWLLEALSTYYEFCGDKAALNIAEEVLARLLPENNDLVRALLEDNTRKDTLADKLALARACLQLYRTNSQKKLLEVCMLLANDIGEHH